MREQRVEIEEGKKVRGLEGWEEQKSDVRNQMSKRKESGRAEGGD